MFSPSLGEQLSQLLRELQDPSLLEEVLVSPELISFLTEMSHGGVGAVVRSPLQIELILRSLNRSSVKRRVRALP